MSRMKSRKSLALLIHSTNDLAGHGRWSIMTDTTHFKPVIAALETKPCYLDSFLLRSEKHHTWYSSPSISRI